MCATCGCGDDSAVRLTLLEPGSSPGSQHVHDPGHRHPDHGHDHSDHSVDHHQADHHHVDQGSAHDHSRRDIADRTVVLEQQILAKNASLASRNRGWLEGRGVFAINLMSSPGAGKTTLLERTIDELNDEIDVFVIEGDQETPLDAERIRASGRPVVQVNTGAGCHLDATMINDAVDRLDPTRGSLLVIENVGNLVCPALFDLGEARRVVLTSVTEGADKPLKYPHMFRGADLVLVNKIDLLPYVDFDLDRFGALLRELNPRVPVRSVIATSGNGVQPWLEWVREQRPQLTVSGVSLDSMIAPF